MRAGDKRFERLEDVISKDELRAIFVRYQKVAGYHVDQVGKGANGAADRGHAAQHQKS